MKSEAVGARGPTSLRRRATCHELTEIECEPAISLDHLHSTHFYSPRRQQPLLHWYTECHRL